METDPAFGGLCLKIWCCVANFHLYLPPLFLAELLFQNPTPKSILTWSFQHFYCAIRLQNLSRSIFLPETIATIGPLPAFPVKAAASVKAPPPSETTPVCSALPL